MLLLLTGPAGSGKTVSLQVIAQEMDIELVEWAEGFGDWSKGSDAGRSRDTTSLHWPTD